MSIKNSPQRPEKPQQYSCLDTQESYRNSELHCLRHHSCRPLPVLKDVVLSWVETLLDLLIGSWTWKLPFQVDDSIGSCKDFLQNLWTYEEVTSAMHQLHLLGKVRASCKALKCIERVERAHKYPALLRSGQCIGIILEEWPPGPCAIFVVKVYFPKPWLSDTQHNKYGWVPLLSERTVFWHKKPTHNKCLYHDKWASGLNVQSRKGNLRYLWWRKFRYGLDPLRQTFSWVL